MKRYKKNLKVEENYVYSYNTLVAYIDHPNKQVILLHWRIEKEYINRVVIFESSKTTSRHINYVAKEFGYNVK